MNAQIQVVERMTKREEVKETLPLSPMEGLRLKYKLFDLVNKPITSKVLCIHTIYDRTSHYTNDFYIEAISHIVGKKIVLSDDPYLPKAVFRRLCEYIIDNYNNKVLESVEVAFNKALRNSKAYLEENTWLKATKDDQPKEIRLDAAGNVAPPKGEKKIKAKALYESKIKGKVISRKEAIEMFVKEIGLTPAGASTYFSNFKSGTW